MNALNPWAREWLNSKAVSNSTIDRLGISNSATRAGAVEIPWRDATFPDGVTTYIHPSARRKFADGSVQKSKMPKGHNGLSFARTVEGSRKFLVVEGIGQHLAAASWAPPEWSVVGMNGIRGIHGKTKNGPATDLKWADGVEVVLVPDSDWTSNPQVRDGALKAARLLTAAGATCVRIADLTPHRVGDKDGLDDILARLDELDRTGFIEGAINDAATADEPAGGMFPPPTDPVKAAAALVDRIETADGRPVWQRWRGDWFRWDGAKWAPMPLETLNTWLMSQTKDAQFIDPDGGVQPWEPNTYKVRELEAALGTLHLNRPYDDEPVHALACRNGVVDLATRELSPPDANVFSLAALPFDYDQEAACPRWAAFLSDVLPPDQIPLLRQWFGYVVSGRTDLHKILSLVGRPRSGKGTIGRVLEALVGRDSTCSPTVASLASQFGLQTLVGKSLAIIGDARWKGVAGIGQAVERLKGVSGEDAISVPRKHREDWFGTLGVRFMIMSNDQPSFTDASAALASRMLNIETRQSFLGREDPGLTPALLAELPGILNWALDGLAELEAAGRFVEPESSVEIGREVARSSSPVLAWVESEVELVAGHQVPLDTLYSDFKTWAEGEGFSFLPIKSRFSQDLQAALGTSVQVDRTRLGGVKTRVITGVKPVRRVFTPGSGR